MGATDARGRVAPQSSRGPAHDGRVKPELVAFGDAGSSDAAALVSGISLLVQQAYRDLHGGALPPSALVRAVLLNSAQDVGRPEVDFESGYGQADALAAVCTVLENRHHASQIEQDAEKFIELDIPAGTGQLKITLAWLDPEAAPNAPRALVNDLDLDLDLELPGAGPAQRWLPWTLSAYPHPDSLALPARRRADHLNNAEQITLRNPAPGRYRLRVRGFQLSSGAAQAYSLTYEMTPAGCEWRAPNLQRNVRPGEATALRWRWAGPATTGRIEFRPVGSAAWQLVAETVDLSAQSLTWMPPNLTTTLAQLRCLTAGQEFISDTFALTRPLPLRVGYVCAAEALLTWPAVPGATTYQVYQLGATRLEPLLTTADTLLVLPQPGATAGYYAVAPRLADQLTERSNTAGLNAAGLDCYIRSFIPRQAVADTVRLTLLLNSVYRLRAIHLQRRDPATGTFKTIASRQPLRQTRLELVDLTAAPGNNQYRIWGQDAAGRSFFSGTETVQLVRAAELLVFPVPVRAGDPLFFAAEPGATVRARLYDGLGRVSREAEGNGALNSLDTHDLRPGLYVLRVTTSTGPVIVRRVVVQ